MKVTVRNHTVLVEREEGDSKIKGGSWGSKESAFFSRVRRVLEEDHSIRLVRIRAWKDGHMFGSEATPILRPPKPRNLNKPPQENNFAIYDNGHMVRCPGDEYNKQGWVNLSILPNYWQASEEVN